jgi:hypothetical protein
VVAGQLITQHHAGFRRAMIRTLAVRLVLTVLVFLILLRVGILVGDRRGAYRGRFVGVIAEQLTITEGTVKTHVNSILTKLHVSDRTQAAVLAWREGVIDPDI